MADSALVQVRDVHKVYRRGAERIDVLQGLSLEVPQGDFLALMGPSGSGKTTLARIIANRTKSRFISFSAVTPLRFSAASRFSPIILPSTSGAFTSLAKYTSLPSPEGNISVG